MSTLPPHEAGRPAHAQRAGNGERPAVEQADGDPTGPIALPRPVTVEPSTPDVDLGIPGLVDPVQVGRGGSGAVYRARQPGLNRVVAVKVLSTVLDQAGRDRFDREAYAMGTVAGHPNIVQVFTTGTTDTGRPYLVMPFVDGGSLADRLPVPWQYAVHYAVRLCGALETAHRAGVLHRDVKPSNVLVSVFGEPLLADFGIARVSGGFETSEGLISASIPYAAPEILEGRPATPAADVYALAATVFCAVVGHPPFAAGKDEAMVSLYLRISRDPVPDLRGYGVPDPVCRVLEAALAKDPAARPQAAALFGRLLQEAQRATGQPVTPMAVTDEVDRTTMATPLEALRHASSPTVLGARPQPLTAAGVVVLPDGSLPADPAAKPPARRRGWIVLALVVALVIAAGVIGTIVWWPEKGPPPVPGTPRQSLELADPTAMLIGPDGSLYVADSGLDQVLRVTSTGDVQAVAGTGESGDSGDGRPAVNAELDDPSALALAPDGSLYLATGGRIRRIDPQGLIRPVTGFDDYLSVRAMVCGSDGTLYLATDNTVLMRRSSGEVSTFAADFSSLQGMVMRSDGTLLVSDSSRSEVFALDTNGSRTVVAGTEDPKASDGDGFEPSQTRLSGPTGLALDPQGRLYVAESSANRVRRVQEDGTMLTVAGDPDDYSSGNDGDGDDAIKATFNLRDSPLAIDGNGLLYIADVGNSRIRTVDQTGIVRAWG